MTSFCGDDSSFDSKETFKKEVSVNSEAAMNYQI
jgi:hypothetical protein